jgi:rubredoxin
MESAAAETAADVWVCTYCGYEYHPANGDPENGVPSGTSWQDIDDEWCCPNCGATKADFDKV